VPLPQQAITPMLGISFTTHLEVWSGLAEGDKLGASHKPATVPMSPSMIKLGPQSRRQ